MVYCCCCSVTKLCPILCDPWTSACQASLSSIISWNLLKFISIELLMLSNHLILCTSFSFFLQSFPASVFSNELALRTRSPKYWSFSFSNSSSNEYSGLISTRIDWLDLLAVQETLRVLSHLFFSQTTYDATEIHKTLSWALGASDCSFLPEAALPLVSGLILTRILLDHFLPSSLCPGLLLPTRKWWFLFILLCLPR